MTQEVDPLEHGYSRALWMFPGKFYLRPDGLSVVSEDRAIAELADDTEDESDE
jgi:hypothetical protein